MSSEHTWGHVLRESQAKAHEAITHHEQNIQAAYADIRSARKVGKLIGLSRDEVIRVLNPGDGVPVVDGPRFPIVVWLRAPGRGGLLWARISRALTARGYLTIGSQDQAWHLSRAGLTIVYVDLDCLLDDDPILIEVRRAVERQPTEEARVYPLRGYLPTMAGIRLEQEHPELIDWPVHEFFDNDVRWKAERGGAYPRMRVFDPQAINNLGQPGAYAIDAQFIGRTVDELVGKKPNLTNRKPRTMSDIKLTVADLKELADSSYEGAVLYLQQFDDDGEELDEPRLAVWTGDLVRPHEVIVRKEDLLEYIRDDREDEVFEAYLEAFGEDIQDDIDDALDEADS